ncbi:putative inhibitor of apoptosis isoform X1 [Octopus bimaculoides]|uniref:RING-type domain-containing protein n=2 Tax=Octopus bimaculoides TaxID=37653 RepID=A0A0L8IDN8_OCTBM|nr:putative inhibitor of apoptosis isoform X1 [Octopus bimaculoides]|eukprot:XP_014774540.1 PREDICTED: putative inhibitor of apoptosis isoform X1 [Octopus bimaculoides]
MGISSRFSHWIRAMTTITERKFLKNLSTPPGDLRYEIERLLTFFENIHPKLTSVQLSGNGYYYDTTAEKIMCYFCKTVVKFSDSSFKHDHSCRYKVDSFPVYLYDETDGENAAAFNVQNTERETETVVTTSTEKVINSNKNEMLDMQKRLDTFKNWNKSVPVTPTDLAKNGFYYLGYGDAVKCAYCSVQLRNWKENDDVHKEHTRFSPKCPNLESFMKMDLKYELNRIKSFVKWTTSYPLKAKDLAANGFYHKGPADNVCCIFCKCEINNWKANDNIKEKHRSVSPNCPFLCEKLVGNVPIQARSNILFDRPIHPNLALLSERLKTFSSWPKDKKQKPEVLAEAGFFHNGKSDTVICFSCDGGLCNWDDDDQPWHEHARWFPRCTFVQQMKDSKYIASASMKNKASSYNQVLDNASSVLDGSAEPTEGSSTIEDVTTFPNTPTSGILPKSRNLKYKYSCLDTPPVLAVLSMGYKRNVVKRVVKNKIKETGSSFSKASQLLEAIHKCPDFDDDIEDVSDEEEPVQTTIKNDTEMSANADLVKENNMLKELKLCKICLDEELSVVFLPCGHLVSCASCAPALSNCPVCRQKVHGMVKTFF